jgi:hypothetical protein
MCATLAPNFQDFNLALIYRSAVAIRRGDRPGLASLEDPFNLPRCGGPCSQAMLLKERGF